MMATIANPVTDIVGVGDALAGKLASRGVFSDLDLLARPPRDMSTILDGLVGLSRERLEREVIPQARFLRLKGVDGQLADCLVALGYVSLSQLMMQDPATLAAEFGHQVTEGRLHRQPAPEEILGLLLDAAKRASSGTLQVLVLDAAADSPIEGAIVRVNGDGLSGNNYPITEATDKLGKACIELLSPTTHEVSVSAKRFKSRSGAVRLTTGLHSLVRVKLKKGRNTPRVVDEFQGGVIAPSPSWAYLPRKALLEDLQPIPPFLVQEVGKERVQLGSLWFAREDNVVFVPEVSIPRKSLPTVAVGDVLVPNKDGELKRRPGLTGEAYRIKLVQDRLGKES